MSKSEELRYWEERDFIIDLLQQVPARIFWKDKEGVYLGCNQNFASSLGYKSPEEVIGKTDYDLPSTKEESDAYRADDKQVMESKRAKLNIEEEQTLSNGQKIFLLTNKIPLMDKNENVVGILGIYLDITDKKALQEKLIQTEASEAKFKALSALSGMIAHELRIRLGKYIF